MADTRYGRCTGVSTPVQTTAAITAADEMRRHGAWGFFQGHNHIDSVANRGGGLLIHTQGVAGSANNWMHDAEIVDGENTDPGYGYGHMATRGATQISGGANLGASNTYLVGAGYSIIDTTNKVRRRIQTGYRLTGGGSDMFVADDAPSFFEEHANDTPVTASGTTVSLASIDNLEDVTIAAIVTFDGHPDSSTPDQPTDPADINSVAWRDQDPTDTNFNHGYGLLAVAGEEFHNQRGEWTGATTVTIAAAGANTRVAIMYVPRELPEIELTQAALLPELPAGTGGPSNLSSTTGSIVDLGVGLSP